MKRSKSTKVTRRMRRVLAEICSYKAEHDGQAPTRRELMKLCGLHSPSTVSYYLQRLETAGLIRTQSESEARGIEVVGGSWEPPDSLAEQLELAAHEKREAEVMAKAVGIVGLSMAGLADESVITLKAAGDILGGMATEATHAIQESVKTFSTGQRYPQIAAIGKLVRDDGRN